MTPASSVLLLTTLTGFGYGLLAWLGVFGAFGLLPAEAWFMPVAVAMSLAVASGGLLASMLHLGRPERAWRSFSQWRSSWLSREGIASLLTYPPAVAFAALWWIVGPLAPATRGLGLLAAIMGMVTVFCTAMIYASLTPIRQWHNTLTVPLYLVLALFSGSMLLSAIVAVWTGQFMVESIVAIVIGLIAVGVKIAYWRLIDAQSPLTTLASATGLTPLSPVRPLDQPHFTENYILREMGYQIARKHAGKLRRIIVGVAFVLPIILLIVASAGLAPYAFVPIAVVIGAFGLYVERWLFFAEATHVSTIYYGRTI